MQQMVTALLPVTDPLAVVDVPSVKQAAFCTVCQEIEMSPSPTQMTGLSPEDAVTGLPEAPEQLLCA